MRRLAIAAVSALCIAGLLILISASSIEVSLPVIGAVVPFILILAWRAEDALAATRRFRWSSSLLIAIVGGVAGGAFLWLTQVVVAR